MTTTRTTTTLVALALALALGVGVAGCSSTPEDAPEPTQAPTPTTTPTPSSTQQAAPSGSAGEPTDAPEPEPVVPAPSDPLSEETVADLNAGAAQVVQGAGLTGAGRGGAVNAAVDAMCGDAEDLYAETGQEVLIVVPMIDPSGGFDGWRVVPRDGYTSEQRVAILQATYSMSRDEAAANAQAWIDAQPDPSIWHLYVVQADIA